MQAWIEGSLKCSLVARVYGPSKAAMTGEWKLPPLRSRRNDAATPKASEGAIMSGFDIFAWIVLIILIASAVAVFCIAGWLPGHIAKTRNHPWAQAVTVAGWITLIFGFALWPVALIWAYVDVPAQRKPEHAR